MGFIGRAVAPAPISANDVPDLPTSKITSGTFADARISSSSVSQHATSFDDNKIVNDLSTLGLRVHTQENLNASNTNSASFDVFQDSSAITNLVTCKRNTGEYMEAIVDSFSESSLTINAANYSTYFTTGSTQAYRRNDTNFDYTSFTNESNDNLNEIWSSSSGTTHQDSSGAPIYHVFLMDLGVNRSFKPTQVNQSLVNGAGDSPTKRFLGFNTQPTSLGAASDELVFATFSGYSQPSTQNSSFSAPTDFYRYLAVTKQYATGNNSAEYDTLFQGTLKTNTPTVNATGSFEGATITAGASTSSMGAVITYQDNAGTNALNTDIILKLSDFATGIKMAKVNDLSVTAGTSLKYKIEFANQSSGSKEARIRGVSLQY
jgi:hypothetical protein